MPTTLWITAIVVLIINLPFGFWRAGTDKFKLSWFLAIHMPVPFVMVLRFYIKIDWQMTTFLILASAFLAGQFLGGKFYLKSKIDKTL